MRALRKAGEFEPALPMDDALPGLRPCNDYIANVDDSSAVREGQRRSRGLNPPTSWCQMRPQRGPVDPDRLLLIYFVLREDGESRILDMMSGSLYIRNVKKS